MRLADESKRKRGPPHNKGQTKSPLGHAHSWIDRTCEKCGKVFQTQVKRVSRGGGRFCGKMCNPSYVKAQPPGVKARRHNLKANYGLTPEDYEAMVLAQNNKCAICDSEHLSAYGRFHIDHCHTTGKVRGLLCTRCNTGIGMLGDSIGIVTRALAYLTEHDSRPTRPIGKTSMED